MKFGISGKGSPTRVKHSGIVPVVYHVTKQSSARVRDWIHLARCGIGRAVKLARPFKSQAQQQSTLTAVGFTSILLSIVYLPEIFNSLFLVAKRLQRFRPRIGCDVANRDNIVDGNYQLMYEDTPGLVGCIAIVITCNIEQRPIQSLSQVQGVI